MSRSVTHVKKPVGVATPADLQTLLPLMRAFYAEEQLRYSADVEAAMGTLLASADLGFVLYDDRGAYLALTYGFCLELGGRDAFIDELYVTPPARRRGIARALMENAFHLAKDAGVHALLLEVAEPSPHKLAFYTSCGFRPRAHPLMARLVASEGGGA